MRRVRTADAERGVTTVVVALAFTVLIASVGIGVDTGALAYKKSRAQHSADAAAVAIAQDCVLNKSTCSSAGASGTATYFVNQNAPGATATIPGGVSAASGSVKVKVDQNVATNFFAAVGVASKPVSASAKATWGGHPVEGSPVLPLAIPYCMFTNPPVAYPNPFLLRSDVLKTVMDLITGLPVLGTVVGTLLNTLTGVTQSCKNHAGQDVVMLKGPIWLSGIEGAINGLLTWDPTLCNMHLNDISAFVGSTLSAVVPPACINKLGTSIKKNQIILLPVYEPANNLLNLGFNVQACLLVATCVSVPPKLGVKVIGFAPFKITGWNYAGNSQNDPNAPTCTSLTLLLTVSLGCNGIQGYFVNSMTKDPLFTYSTSGLDLGANAVSLSE